MKNVKIKYNPFTKTTEVHVDGKKPKGNSKLNFGEKRLQEWAGELPEVLVNEYQDRNFSIEFTGTLADFEDLKAGLSAPNVGINIENYKHNCTPSVSETEAEVDKIFEEIKKGPVSQLKDKSIIEAFEKAKNLRFEINVVATMSSGKSTLINALLDKKLMPVAAEATTATIVNIIDTDIDKYKGTAYNADNVIVDKDDNLTYAKMKQWNSDEEISSIDIEGRIPCVNSVGMKLVLIDTPGPNNSADKRHRAMTYGMLSDSDKSLVLFVMRADALGVDDEKVFLDYVCDEMNKGGKQSRDRYIFAINKMDVFNPEEESVESALVNIKDNILEKRGIFNPNIFPVSAQAALEARTRPTIEQVLPVYKQYIKYFPSTHFDNYYQFSHLPGIAKNEIGKYLTEAKENSDKKEGEYTAIEIHSGIVSIEKAIELYINKYARTIKVYDLVQSFNKRLKELAAVATIEQGIKDDAAKKTKFEKLIDEIKRKIRSGESARQLSDLVEDIDISETVNKEIQTYVDAQQTKINKTIYKYSNSSKVLKAEAERQAKEIEKDNRDLPDQLEAQIDRILTSTYATLYKTIVKKYETYIKDLGLTVVDNVLVINPLDFIAEDLDDLSQVLNANTSSEDEGSDTTVDERVKGERRSTKFGRWLLGEYKYKTITVTKHIPKWVDYVNMSTVVNEYFEPMQMQLKSIKEIALNHVQAETYRIKEKLHEQLHEINNALERKLIELNDTINNVNITAQEMEEKKRNLDWMNGIIERINKLINF